MTVTLPRPECVNILWTILSGLHLAEYVTKSISKFIRNVNKILFLYYRLENGGHIFLGFNGLTHYCQIISLFGHIGPIQKKYTHKNWHKEKIKLFVQGNTSY